MSDVKVSVVIVSYNQKDYTKEAILSVLNQNVSFPIEIIIADDASTDGTLDMLKDLSRDNSSIKLLLQPSNVGPYINFAKAHNSCIGEYVAHLDGDDRMLQDKLQIQADILDRNPDISIVCHNLRIFDIHNNTLGYFNNDNQKIISTGEDLLRLGTYFGHSSKMYRRSSRFKDTIDGNAGDWLSHLENACFGNIFYTNKVLGEYRKHTAGITFGVKNKLKQLEIQEYTLNKLLQNNCYSRELIQFAFTRIYFVYAWDMLINGIYDEFQRVIILSIQYNIKLSFMHSMMVFLRRFPRILLLLIRTKLFFKI
jgi:glycosyltransferase involved in cell wall biosynthesis